MQPVVETTVAEPIVVESSVVEPTQPTVVETTSIVVEHIHSRARRKSYWSVWDWLEFLISCIISQGKQLLK